MTKKLLLNCILFILVSSAFGQNELEQKMLRVDSLDHKKNKKPIEYLDIQIGTGFHEKNYHFQFYLNGQPIDTFTCMTDESIGYCLTENLLVQKGYVKFGRIYLSHSEFETGDILKVVVDDEFIEIPLRQDYSDLILSRYNGAWKGLFIRGIGDHQILE